ncbi:hypothetical protein BGZ96_007973 [Linnemannia gamsii]|uniref:HCP-like protein n=1 Tax=Linnemannia gamsii TaxID=64522 RepID=A0ABQ7K1K4_9FUNG|nr:hypothetical protein BGZ96_007973 [Linnemannia gamsii]
MVHVPQQQIQALRPVDKSISPNSVPLATPDEIIHVETHPDPVTKKEIVLWDDILQAFDNAVQVRHKTMVIPFLKGKDFVILEPRRIAAIPDSVLDVIVRSSVADNNLTSLQVQQSESPAAPPPLPPSYESTIRGRRPSTRNGLPKYGASSTSSAPSVATVNAQCSSGFGPDEVTTSNNSHMDRPLAFPLARGPQMLLEGQTQRVEGASCGDKEDQVTLGDMYRDGKGVPQDYHIAMVWYLKAARQAFAPAQYNIGDFYFLGHGVRQDFSQAMEWYIKAASLGHAPSLFSIGFLFHDGLGVRKDCTQAMDWYLKSANQGYALAQYNLGLLYSQGSRGVRQDYAKAMDWHFKAAFQGHAPAQYNVGLLYDFGRGVPQDFGRAMLWYLKAAEHDHAGSQYSIGFLYDHGQGVLQDYIKAAEWYQKAADQGYEGAENALDTLEKKWAGY